MSQIVEAIVTIATAIVGLAIIATLVSRRAQTPQVIQAAGTAFGSSILAAQAPVTGRGTPNLSYPGQSGFGGAFGNIEIGGSFGF